MKNKQTKPRAKPKGVQSTAGFILYFVHSTIIGITALLKAIALGGILFALNCAKHNKAVHQ